MQFARQRSIILHRPNAKGAWLACICNALGPLSMASALEILFVDPAVSNLDTILGSLRTDVEAIVLDAAMPAARQIATALAGRKDLGAVHVIAHGAPGRVSFAAGDWSTDTLPRDAGDLSA